MRAHLTLFSVNEQAKQLPHSSCRVIGNMEQRTGVCAYPLADV